MTTPQYATGSIEEPTLKLGSDPLSLGPNYQPTTTVQPVQKFAIGAAIVAAVLIIFGISKRTKS
jgi:hypothetical protein